MDKKEDKIEENKIKKNTKKLKLKKKEKNYNTEENKITNNIFFSEPKITEENETNKNSLYETTKNSNNLIKERINENKKKFKSKRSNTNSYFNNEINHEKKLSLFDTEESIQFFNKKKEEIENKNNSLNISEKFIVNEDEEEKINNINKFETIEIENYENLITSTNNHNIPIKNYEKIILIEDLFLNINDISKETIQQTSIHSYDSIIISDELLPGWMYYKLYYYYSLNVLRKKFNFWKKFSGIKSK